MMLTYVIVEASLTVVKVLVNNYFCDVELLFTHDICLVDGTLPKDDRYFIRLCLLPAERWSVNKSTN